MIELKDKIVAVTGAAGNLGEATAMAFNKAGARLAVIDRKRDDLQSSFANVAPEGESFYYVTGDLTNSQSVSEVVDQIRQFFGRIDVLINIAGGFTMGPPVYETPESTWDFMLDLNAKSVFLMCRAVVPLFLEQAYGKIVNIGARAALSGKPNMAPYVVSKSAVIRLTESMAAELRHISGININCVLPGTIDTLRNRHNMPDADFSKWVAPQDLANVIVFLASDEARAINGASIPVYGRS